MQAPPAILILIPYFGSLPWYFPYFLHSCKHNPTIDVLIFSDTKEQHQLPDNVRIVHTTLDDIRRLATDKLGLKVCIDSPYKLCDFKPAYGLIFEDYTKDYDFWAISDIDVIYGDLRSFFTPDLLTAHDFINVRHDYTTGCFMLIRNNATMKQLFRRSRDHEKVFTSKPYLGFDELNFKHCELNEGKQLQDIVTDIECFTHLVKHAAQNKEINAHFDFILIEGVPGRIRYSGGQIIYNNQFEAALYHLYWLKRAWRPRRAITTIPDTYFISPTRIYHKHRKKTYDVQE